MTIRFSEQEKAEVTAAAARRGLYPAGYLATTALEAARAGAPKVDEQLHAGIGELAALRAHLARVGNNLNQITRAFNSGGQPHPAALDHVLKVLYQALARVDAAAYALARRRA
jgi:Bacterial mobilisation protein (MobC)